MGPVAPGTLTCLRTLAVASADGGQQAAVGTGAGGPPTLPTAAAQCPGRELGPRSARPLKALRGINSNAPLPSRAPRPSPALRDTLPSPRGACAAPSSSVARAADFLGLQACCGLGLQPRPRKPPVHGAHLSCAAASLEKAPPTSTSQSPFLRLRLRLASLFLTSGHGCHPERIPEPFAYCCCSGDWVQQLSSQRGWKITTGNLDTRPFPQTGNCFSLLSGEQGSQGGLWGSCHCSFIPSSRKNIGPGAKLCPETCQRNPPPTPLPWSQGVGRGGPEDTALSAEASPCLPAVLVQALGKEEALLGGRGSRATPTPSGSGPRVQDGGSS
ncbi:uncharacterized protein LOC125108456 [Lutra lutra]|uniref:uncharacterized protein LOC125108456 n=1 Tax=Lutra lutra TaxID=9657 RepID=UPI001FD449DD|nr:uncharacterized protein LOC125108456 [Lutra lutra]